jgi:molybdopterin-guanine dinucleotide biosynthesis protein A
LIGAPIEDELTTGGAVLAGGKCERMGQDKASMDAGGATMLERGLDALRSIASPVLIVSDTGDRFCIEGYREVADLTPGLGPVGGIATALRYLGPGLHLMVACDMPFLRTDLLRLLVDLAENGDEAVVPKVRGRAEPLCAAYSYSALPALQQYLREGNRAAHRALQSLQTRYVDEEQLKRIDPDLESFINLNTQADADRWLPARRR